MIGNYISSALRNIYRSKFFSSINIFGLCVGLTAAILISIFVAFEYSYDKFQPFAYDVYRVELHTYRNATLESKSALTPPAVAISLSTTFPEVQEIARIAANPGKARVVVNRTVVKETKAYIADSSIFKVFHFEFIDANTSDMFNGPSDAVISESLAKKLFGLNWDVKSLTETIEIQSDGISGVFNVKGVFKNFPENSHFNPQLIVPNSYLRQLVGQLADDNNWNFNFFHSYVRLKNGSDPLALQSRFNAFVSEARRDALQSENASYDFHFLPMTDIHLKSSVQFDLEEGGDSRIVFALGITGVIILVVAWINFINLSTARGIRRAREIGVRKVMGAAKLQLVIQFVIEALLVNAFALFLALIIIALLGPVFAEMIEVPPRFMTVSFLLSEPNYVLIGSGLFCAGVLFSALYPAFVLSSYIPIKALKSEVLKPKGLTFRKSLLVVQTVISLVMIVGTFVVYEQVTFMRTTDLGIDIDKVLIVEAPEVFNAANAAATNVFKSEVENLSFVKGFTMSSVLPGHEITFRSYNLSNKLTKSSINCGIIGVDTEFFRNFDVDLVAGQFFSEVDSLNSGVILNEEAVSQLGFTNADEAVGAQIVHENKGRKTDYVIRGVVRNYHHRSLHSALEPIMFINGKEITFFCIKLKENAWTALQKEVALIGNTYDRLFPGSGYTHFFLDQNFDDQYKSEIKFGTLFFSFSVLAIIISALGLLGLSTFMISLRTKEVGIRKVMGADAWSITKLLLTDYTRLLIVSMIVGIPMSHYLITYWLQNFAFKIDTGLFLFVVPLLLLSMVIFSVVGIQLLRAASANPVDVIREQ